jgi:hypothetical protein
MEENFSDTEHISILLISINFHIVHGKRSDKFTSRIIALRTMILVIMAFGAGLSKYLRLLMGF